MPSEFWAAILGAFSAGGVGYLGVRSGSNRADHGSSGDDQVGAACGEEAEQPGSHLELISADHGS